MGAFFRCLYALFTAGPLGDSLVVKNLGTGQAPTVELIGYGKGEADLEGSRVGVFKRGCGSLAVTIESLELSNDYGRSLSPTITAISPNDTSSLNLITKNIVNPTGSGFKMIYEWKHIMNEAGGAFELCFCNAGDGSCESQKILSKGRPFTTTLNHVIIEGEWRSCSGIRSYKGSILVNC